MPETRAERRLFCKSRIGAIYQYDAPGFEFSFEELVRPPGVRVMALTPDRKYVWLTREYRQEIGSWDLRLPGGKIFNQFVDYEPFYVAGLDLPIEHVVHAAQKEFLEEVGLRLLSTKRYGVSQAGATVHWPLHYVAGSTGVGADKLWAARPQLELGERIAPQPVAVETVLDLVLDGQLGEERSGIFLLRFLREEGLI